MKYETITNDIIYSDDTLVYFKIQTLIWYSCKLFNYGHTLTNGPTVGGERKHSNLICINEITYRSDRPWRAFPNTSGVASVPCSTFPFFSANLSSSESTCRNRQNSWKSENRSYTQYLHILMNRRVYRKLQLLLVSLDLHHLH